MILHSLLFIATNSNTPKIIQIGTRRAITGIINVSGDIFVKLSGGW